MMQQAQELVNRSALVDIDANLERHDVAALKYLIQDKVNYSDLEKCEQAIDVFSLIEHSKHSPLLLHKCIAYCLILIGQRCLVRKLDFDPTVVEIEVDDDNVTISAYRKALFNVAQDLSDKEVERIIDFLKTILTDFSPSIRHLDRIESFEKVFSLFNILEKRKNICSTDCSLLKRIVSKIHRNDLLKIIEPFSGCEEDSRFYPMNTGEKGKCLIISNYSFENKDQFDNRDGTHKDIDILSSTFRQLNFDIIVHENLTANQIDVVINQLSNSDHSQACAFVVCILSHGDKGIVYGVDGMLVHMEMITCKFTSSNCKSLAGKPKMFIFQACQGSKEHLLQRTERITTRQMTRAGYSDVCMLLPEDNNLCDSQDTIPDGSDFLLCYSTTPDYRSYRNTQNGSFYIQTLCQQIIDNCIRLDMGDILVQVNNQLSKENIVLQNGSIAKTTAFNHSTLRAKLHFYPDNIKS